MSAPGITVIGAGIVGVAVASYLQRDGHAVTLVTPYPQVSGWTRSAVQPRHWFPEQSSTPAPHSVSQARERPSSHPKQPSSIWPLQSSSTALPQTSIDSVRTLHRKTPPRQRAMPSPQAVVQGCSAPSTQVSA